MPRLASERSWTPGEPHLVLALGIVGVLAAEYAYRTHGHPYTRHSPTLLLLEPAIAAVALGLVWRRQERLRLVPVLGLALAFHLVWIALHLHLSVPPDVDVPKVYGPEGSSLVHGRYPHSEYPPAAVLLFALEAWVAPEHLATANRLLMVPFQLGTVAAIWGLRTRYSSWLAVVVAVWPMNAFYWEFRYDLVPTALLVAGLALALRGRWGWAGVALGVGTAAKWTPALAFAALGLWCLANRLRGPAVRLTAFFAAALAVFYVPFLAWSPGAVGSAYTQQGGRRIIGEAIWYLAIRAFGIRHHFREIPLPVGAPRSVDVAATVVQAALVVALLAATALLARTLPAAVALAALAPVAFLVTNRIFSPQYLVPMLAAWAAAVALLASDRREQAALTGVALLATVANAFVFPFVLWSQDRTWLGCSAVLFACSLLVTGRLALLGLRERSAA